MDTNFSININNILIEPEKDGAACERHIMSINHPELKFVAVQYPDKTEFSGVATNRLFNGSLISNKYMELLMRAYTNRTRERNYFRLYCQLLENELSDDEFDNEIDAYPDKYVVKSPEKASIDDIYFAMRLSDHMMGIDSSDDFSSSFSIDDESIESYINLIGNE